MSGLMAAHKMKKAEVIQALQELGECPNPRRTSEELKHLLRLKLKAEAGADAEGKCDKGLSTKRRWSYRASATSTASRTASTPRELP